MKIFTTTTEIETTAEELRSSTSVADTLLTILRNAIMPVAGTAEEDDEADNAENDEEE